ncbi:extracellular solute-binding protein [Telmatospirillum sp. J64-1]|uniref:extracellular solute-binding protein n=1 Tax=Telmatospirillum sp. J64-1 TaxID=2502183 RepID=UPI00115D2E33|nr:extracellular solute-binding protein [Telmatospirillum sp. J64-1]
MERLKGLTWDHPRGRNALMAAARRPELAESGLEITWDTQPLEGFESHPIADLCARYDLVVLDHPHVGEAVAAGCLLPLEEIFAAETLAALGDAAIGPSMSSYAYAGRHWALPLDAATQVLACRADLLGAPPPQNWNDVVTLSRETGSVAMSLAGPHAVLSFFSICAALGEPPAQEDPGRLVSRPVGEAAFDLLAQLGRLSPASVAGKNPIGILDHMSIQDDVLLCPLVYGYVNYAAPKDGKAVSFFDAPRWRPEGRPGSTLGGTGIGVSKRCPLSPQLKAHLLWLMDAETQSRFIPAHDGQPSRRDAWADAEVNRAWGNFYRNTTATLEAAYVRPRFDGYIAFQTKASALLREAIAENRSAAAAVEDLAVLYAAHHATGAAI